MCIRDRLRAVDKSGDWPDVSEEALLTELEDWLAPFLQDVYKRQVLYARKDLDQYMAQKKVKTYER